MKMDVQVIVDELACEESTRGSHESTQRPNKFHTDAISILRQFFLT